METDFLKLIGTHFFGMTNFGDLQSITFANQYTIDNNYMFGQTFFDFLRFWINKFSGLEMEITSIGLRLREYYFSHAITGAPAPGIISELIINFGFFGISIIILLFGMLTNLLSRSIDPNKNIINLYVYAQLLIFFLLLPKVDSSHIDSLIWNILPFYIFGFICMIISKLKIINKKG